MLMMMMIIIIIIMLMMSIISIIIVIITMSPCKKGMRRNEVLVGCRWRCQISFG